MAIRTSRSLRPLTGWLALYRLSWRLGLRSLREHGVSREALIRLIGPLDPIRYVEMPRTVAALQARPGSRVFDLASPKLVAALLAEGGVEVTSIDASDSEVATWQSMAGHIDGLSFGVGDGRKLPFADSSFDHAYSLSVLEHIADDGDLPALAEIARVVKPGARVVITLPFRDRYEEEWLDQPMYGEQQPGSDGRYFFYRHYDRPRLMRLIDSVESLDATDIRFHSLVPNLHRTYEDNFPKLVPIAPLFGLLALHRTADTGDVVSVVLVKR